MVKRRKATTNRRLVVLKKHPNLRVVISSGKRITFVVQVFSRELAITRFHKEPSRGGNTGPQIWNIIWKVGDMNLASEARE